jgi:membrane associated rhomboid family serine protease
MLFYGSVISGSVSIIIEKMYQRQTKSIFLKTFPRLFQTTFSVCGSSAATYGFIGAEFGMICIELVRMKKKKLGSIQKLRAEQKMADLLFSAMIRICYIGIEVYFMFTESQPFIGHSSHIGGFIFGFLYINIKNNL